MCRIEKRSKYDDYALDDDEIIVFDSFEDYANSIKDPSIYKEFFKRNPDRYSAPSVLKFVHNETEAKEFVKKAIEAGDEDFLELQKFAEEENIKGGAFAVCTGECDDYSRFDFTKQGYLLDDSD